MKMMADISLSLSRMTRTIGKAVTSPPQMPQSPTARPLKENFKIRKEPFADKFDGSAANDNSDTMYAAGQAQYTKDGVLLECECYAERISINFSHPYPSRFEDAYIPLQSPFELGDIVKMTGDSRPAIVQVSQEDWKRSLERNTNGSRKIPPTTTTPASQLNFLTTEKCIMCIRLFCAWKKSTSGMISWNGICFRRPASS